MGGGGAGSDTTGATNPTSTTGAADPGSTTTVTTAAETNYPQFLADLGVPTVVQLTPIEGGGFRPILEWEPVAGAERYFVAVTAPDGRLYWAWQTSDTSSPVGGLPRLEEDAFGPAVSRGMTWTVIALDTAGAIVGTSAIRPIAP